MSTNENNIGADESLARRLAALFGGNQSAHGTHGEPERDGLKWSIKRTARTLREPPTPELWQQHVRGERPMGVILINGGDLCQATGIDVDQYDADADIMDVVARVERGRMPLVPVQSKSGGLHLWRFFPEPVPAAVARAEAVRHAAQLGLDGVEIFPKQAHLDAERGDVGNWIIAPHFGGDFGGKLRPQAGMKVTGSLMTLPEFLSVAEERRVPPEEAEPQGFPEELLPEQEGPKTAQAQLRKVYSDLKAAPEGGRNEYLFGQARYLARMVKAGWIDGEVVRAKLTDAGQKCRLPSDEVYATIQRGFKYAEHDAPPPLPSDFWPHIERIQVERADPVMYHVHLAGGMVKVNAHQLNKLSLFNEQCIVQIKRSFAPMKLADWNRAVDEKLRVAEDIEVTPDVRPGARFLDMLREFLVNRARGSSREDILHGMPFQDDEWEGKLGSGGHFFRLKDFERFLARDAGVRLEGRGTLADQIREVEGEAVIYKIGGKATQVWRVPAEKIEPLGAIRLPPLPGSPI